MKRSLSREPYLTVAKKIFARVGNPTQGQRVQSAGEEGAIWLELAAMARFARVGNPTQGQRVQSAGEEGAIWLELAAMARGMAFSVLALEVEL